MATLKEYFNKDFSTAIKVGGAMEYRGITIECSVCYDFNAYCSYLMFYCPGTQHRAEFFHDFIEHIKTNRSIASNNLVTLPNLKFYNGHLRFENVEPFKIYSKLPGEFEWKSKEDLPFVGRLYFYAETELNQVEIKTLYEAAKKTKLDIQFRSAAYRRERNTHDKPLAFISHDSRDKESVAKRLALELQNMNCHVWYDEFSLKVGDNLRTTIEKGLKQCSKCILILSPNFISNNGWTKTEFDSVFTRQILEGAQLILPIWHNVSKHEVYEYSPSLLNIKGIIWDEKNIIEVSRQLVRVIDPIDQ